MAITLPVAGQSRTDHESTPLERLESGVTALRELGRGEEAENLNGIVAEVRAERERALTPLAGGAELPGWLRDAAELQELSGRPNRARELHAVADAMVVPVPPSDPRRVAWAGPSYSEGRSATDGSPRPARNRRCSRAPCARFPSSPTCAQTAPRVPVDPESKRDLLERVRRLEEELREALARLREASAAGDR